MTIGYFFLFLVGALFPGFFLYNFFRDAYGEYKASGKYFWETLLSSPGLFFFSLAAFAVLLVLAFVCLAAAL